MDRKELEKKVTDLLNIVAGEGIRQLYQDACSVLSDDSPPLRAPEKAVGNYMREVESGLLSIIMGIARKQDLDISNYIKEDGKVRAAQIDLLVENFLTDMEEETVKFWKKLELHKLAHRRGLRGNKQITDDFVADTWVPYSEIILKLADCINKLFIGYYSQLESIAKNPSKPNRTILMQEVPNNWHLWDHFFENVEDYSSWLPMLKSKGIFKEPPEEYADEEGYLKIQQWPPLGFLIRIATTTQEDSVLEEVAKIAADIPDTENVRVNDDILLLAGHLSANLSSKYMMDRIRSAIEAKGLYTMGEKVSTLLTKLHEGGHNDELLELSSYLIADKKLDGFFEERYIRNNMDFYYYNGLLNVLVNFNRLPIFKQLLSRVIEGLEKAYKDSTSEKFSTMRWRDAFDNESDDKDSLVEMYIAKLAQSARDLIRGKKVSAKEIVDLLLEANSVHEWHIIDALALNLLESSSCDAGLQEKLSDRLRDYETNRRDSEPLQVRSVVHVSPFSDEKLAALSAKEVLEILEKYDGPAEDIWSNAPSKAGLLQGIGRQIKARPLEFCAEVTAFQKLNTDDFADLMHDFRMAEFEVTDDFRSNYVKLAKAFVESHYPEAEERNKRNFSQSVTNIFRRIYNNSENHLSMGDDAFVVLDTIISDKAVGSAILSSNRAEKFHDLANHAINTPAIEALDSLLSCYLTPNTKWKDIWKRDDCDTFREYVHLKILTLSYPAARFQMGMRISCLNGMGKEWFLSEASKVVLNKDDKSNWEAFVAGMMSQRYVFNDLLENVYKDAIRYTNTDEYQAEHNERDEFSIENGLARHISYDYAQLDKKEPDEKSITNYLFKHGSHAIKRMFFVDYKKQLKDDEHWDKSFLRLKALIDWRYEELRKSNFAPDKIEELSGFFNLFPVAVKLDPEWSLEKLKTIMNLLETNGEPYHPDLLIDALLEQAKNYPYLSAECLLSWVKHIKRTWYDFRDVTKLVQAIHETGDEASIEILKEIVSRLSAKGLCRDLVSLFND